jgi:hypothetical protein
MTSKVGMACILPENVLYVITKFVVRILFMNVNDYMIIRANLEFNFFS